MESPFFSIIIPCFNQAHFLPECVKSIISQSFTDWELFIVNDGSTDNTREIAEYYADTDDRIQVINKQNGGLSSARNAGLCMAKGKYIQFIDSDDFLLPSALDEVYVIGNSTLSNIIRGGYLYVDEHNTKVMHTVKTSLKTSLMPWVLFNNIGPAHSVFIERATVERIGFFDESLKSAEDWDFWMRVGKSGASITTLDTTLVAYRYVSNSMSRDAFRMYDALRTVTLRAPMHDTRIKVESNENIDREMDVTSVIKYQLARCLGISIMQGKVEESVILYNQECTRWNLRFTPNDFAPMYSYLSFRYLNSPKEVNLILKEFLPRFLCFFKQIGLQRIELGIVLNLIFLPVVKVCNRNRYGHFLGAIYNRLFLRRIKI